MASFLLVQAPVQPFSLHHHPSIPIWYLSFGSSTMQPFPPFFHHPSIPIRYLLSMTMCKNPSIPIRYLHSHIHCTGFDLKVLYLKLETSFNSFDQCMLCNCIFVFLYFTLIVCIFSPAYLYFFHLHGLYVRVHQSYSFPLAAKNYPQLTKV